MSIQNNSVYFSRSVTHSNKTAQRFDPLISMTLAVGSNLTVTKLFFICLDINHDFYRVTTSDITPIFISCYIYRNFEFVKHRE